jgi:hypothetical protein
VAKRQEKRGYRDTEGMRGQEQQLRNPRKNLFHKKIAKIAKKKKTGIFSSEETRKPEKGDGEIRRG